MKENYQFLGVAETATDEEITARYNELKEKYKEERWQDGEAGNEAARNLTKLETAYEEIISARKEAEKKEEGDGTLEYVAQLLREEKVEQAQKALDAFNERSAEWHYLQAVVYYKKNWTNDSKKQLEIAMQMDPSNVKYRNAYGKMNAKNDYERQQAQPQNPYAGAPDDGQMGGGACSECISCCYMTMCINCLFNCCCPMR